jgi:hypothetical protein
LLPFSEEDAAMQLQFVPTGVGELPAPAFRELQDAAAVVTEDFGQQLAAAGFGDLEARLLALPEVDATIQVVSEGAFESNLEGTVSWAQGNVTSIDVEGSFGGAVALSLNSDGERLTGGSAAGRFDEPTPGALNEALVVGFMRMGVLHNLARLVAGQPPDHMEGGASDWVQVVDVEVSPDATADGAPLFRFDFGLVVDRVPSGTASLWIDAESGLPLRREQTVEFETGEMKVTEIYEFQQ